MPRRIFLDGPHEQRARGHRPCEQIALQLVAAELEQQVALALGLDTFGHHVQADRMRELEYRVDDCARVGLVSMSFTKLRSIFNSEAGNLRR